MLFRGVEIKIRSDRIVSRGEKIKLDRIVSRGGEIKIRSDRIVSEGV
jgi:hypothetical protein